MNLRREFHWKLSFSLLSLLLLLGFIGYLIPWDEVAIWMIATGEKRIGSLVYSVSAAAAAELSR